MSDDHDLLTAALFRQRANELRTIAEGSGDRAARRTLLEIADNYDEMAQQKERLERA